MSDTMIVEGQGNQTPGGSGINMAPGMGLLEEVVMDQHFAQRGRIGRLLTAVAYNPYVLGVGIDEDTAVLINPKPYLL
jgi:cyanophycinase